MNAEIIHRLETSFNEEAGFGGPELRRVAYMMANAFAHNAQLSAGDKPPSEWLRDASAYREGVIGVLMALLTGGPNATKEDIVLMFESAKGRIFSRWVNEQDREGNDWPSPKARKHQ